MSLIDVPPKARRKVTTYGKSGRKRLADIHDVPFSEREAKRRQFGHVKLDGVKGVLKSTTSTVPGSIASSATSGLSAPSNKSHSQKKIPSENSLWDQCLRDRQRPAITQHTTAHTLTTARTDSFENVVGLDKKVRNESCLSPRSETLPTLQAEPDEEGGPDNVVQLLENMPIAHDTPAESSDGRTWNDANTLHVRNTLSKSHDPEVQALSTPKRRSQAPRKEVLPASREFLDVAQEERPHKDVSIFGKRSEPNIAESEVLVPAAEARMSQGSSPSSQPVGCSGPGLSKQTRVPKLTYAAKTRTVLQDVHSDPLIGVATSSDPSDLASPSKRKLRLNDARDMPKLDPYDMEEGGDGVDNGQNGSLKSFRELRQAGVNARAERETEALLDEICGSGPLSRRQTAILDLALKAQSDAHITHVAVNGWTARIADLLGGEPDTICRCLLVSVLLNIVISTAEADLSSLCSSAPLRALREMLNEPNDLTAIARDRNIRFPKSSLTALRKLCGSLSASALWSFEPPSRINPRSLALQCLQNLAKWRGTTGSSNGLLLSSVKEHLVNVLDVSPYESATPHTNNLLSLSVLELTALDTSHQDLLTWDKRLEPLTNFLCSLRVTGEAAPMRVWLGVLRLFLNITNNHSTVCDMVSESEALRTILHVVEQGFEDLSVSQWTNEHDVELDRLILSLGVLINLAESSHHARALFLQTLPSGSSPLHVLLQIFQKRLESAFEVSESPPWVKEF